MSSNILDRPDYLPCKNQLAWQNRNGELGRNKWVVLQNRNGELETARKKAAVTPTLEPQACGGSVTRQSRRQFSRDIFLSCLSDQSNMACLMIIRGVLHPIFHSFLFFFVYFLLLIIQF